MIEFPNFARMGSAVPRFMDMGFTQRGLSTADRIDRKGSRYALDCTFGPYYPEEGRQMVARLLKGKQEGIRVALPLLHNQGSPGAPVVDGAVSTGKTLAIRGLTPGYACKEGFWLSIEEAGQHYLHNVATGGLADSAGDLSITLNEMVRASISDGATIHLAKPMIEGLVTGDDWEWQLSVSRVVPIQFAIEESR